MKRQFKSNDLNRKNFMLNEDRMLVMQAVMQGQIGVEHVTLDEIVMCEDFLFEEYAASVTYFQTYDVVQ